MSLFNCSYLSKSHPKCQPVIFYDSPCPLLALAAERSALRLPTLAGCSARDADVFRRASAIFVKGTVTGSAGHLRIFRGDVHRTQGLSRVPLPEAPAAGFPGMLRILAGYLDIVLAAAPLLIVETAAHRTVQFCHRTHTS